jgi:hypothetical protein
MHLDPSVGITGNGCHPSTGSGQAYSGISAKGPFTIGKGFPTYKNRWR